MKKQSITDRFIPKNDKGKYLVENSITRMRLKEHITEISEKVANVLSVVEIIEGCDIADKETHYAITKLIQEAYSVLLDVSSDLCTVLYCYTETYFIMGFKQGLETFTTLLPLTKQNAAPKMQTNFKLRL